MLTVALDRLALAPGARALDLGCGRGRHLHAIASHSTATAIGLDLSAQDLAATRDAFKLMPERKDWGVAQGTALNLPFADDSFDAVVCSEVLEHIIPYETALDEIARIVKPGGALAVSVPRGWPEAICWRLSKDYQNEPGGHVRIFKRAELKRAIEARGFRFTGGHGAHALHAPYWWLICAVWKRRDDHPLVRAYKRFLEWDLMKRPAVTRALETMLNPVLGKSIVMYFDRTEARA